MMVSYAGGRTRATAHSENGRPRNLNGPREGEKAANKPRHYKHLPSTRLCLP